MDAQERKKVAGYARVSTDDQQLSQQVEALMRYCSYKNMEVVKVYQDVGSGKEYKNRPQFKELLQDVREMKYDAVVVFRLDRLFRNVIESVNFIQEWDKRGVRVHSISEGLDPDTAMGRAMMGIILVLAQLERENISEATKARLMLLKDMGKKLGRPGISGWQIAKIAELRADGKSIRQIADVMNIKKSTVAKYLSTKGASEKKGSSGSGILGCPNTPFNGQKKEVKA
jgi:DNA invertase Pin-like site-specific DNA recombinase